MLQGENMSLKIEQIEYYNIEVKDHVADGSKILSIIADADVSFHAFKAISLEPRRTRFSLFPKDAGKMTAAAEKAGLKIEGPNYGLLIKGDEKTGALADIYLKLSQANIQVIESSGIADINHGYGVLLYLNKEDCKKALAALKGEN
jgi:hypothetical protein